MDDRSHKLLYPQSISAKIYGVFALKLVRQKNKYSLKLSNPAQLSVKSGVLLFISK
jgi:hypothetical protein